MPVRIINGERRFVSIPFVSQAIYDAYQQGQPWDAAMYLSVEIGDVLPAWITAEENGRLAKLTTLDEFEAFTEEVGLRPIEGDLFAAWQQGDAPQKL